jgi:hypothetical protein
MELATHEGDLKRKASTMNLKYVVILTDEERQHLIKLTSSGIAPARRVKRAQILLKSDSGDAGPKWKYEQICASFNMTPMTVMNVRKSFAEKGLHAALYRKRPECEYCPHKHHPEQSCCLIWLSPDSWTYGSCSLNTL